MWSTRRKSWAFPCPTARVLKIVRKAEYMQAVAGRDLAGQVQFFKKRFGEVLLSDGEVPEEEYQVRLMALMELLRARGQVVIGAVTHLFSGESSEETSPEKPAGEAVDGLEGAVAHGRADVRSGRAGLLRGSGGVLGRCDSESDPGNQLCAQG